MAEDPTQVRIRWATAEDMTPIFGLVQELATFEKALDSIAIDEHQFKSDFQAKVSEYE